MASNKIRNVKPTTKTKHTPSNTWFSNAMKSMGLSSMEMIKGMAPSMYEFVSSTTSSSNDLIKDIRSGRVSSSRISEYVSDSPYMKLGKDVMKNTLSDLKSGKFVNPERQKELDKEMEKRLLGFDIDEMFSDMDSAFDDVDFGDDLDDDKVVVNQNNNVINQNSGDNANIYATLMVSESIQNQTKANIEASKASIDTMVTVASNQMMLTKQLGDNIIGHLSSINQNISALLDYQTENMTKYIEASLAYYEQTAPKQVDDDFTGNDSDKFDTSTIFDKNSFNIKNYMQAVKGNLKKTYGNSMIGSLGSMIVENPELFTANPIGMILPSVLSSMVPTVLKESISHLDNTFKNFFPSLLGKVAGLKDSNNPFLSTIGNVFGITEERKTDFKLNKFEKGEIPFDGMTKHSIVEIIPTYLRKILSAITGAGEIAYDWNSGKYASTDTLREAVYDSIRNDTTGTFRYSSVGDEMDKYKAMLTEADQERFDTLLDNFFVALEKSNKHFDPFNNKNGDPFSNVYRNIDADYGVEMGNFLRSAIKNMDKGALMELNASRQEAMRSRRDMMKVMEEDPYSYNLFTIATEMDADSEIARMNPIHSVGGSSKKKGPSMTDLLGDIKSVLYRGINVRIEGRGSYRVNGEGPSDNDDVQVSLNPQATSYDDFERGMRSELGQYTSDLKGSNKSQEDINRDIERFNKQANIDYDGTEIDPNEETGTGPMASVRKKLNKPGVVVADKVKAMDNMLYAFMFGSGQQTFETMLKGLGEKLAVFRDKVVNDYIQPLATKLFGTKDEDGFSRDGLFSNGQNKIKDFFLDMRHQFSGKAYIDSNGNMHEEKSEEETAVGSVKKMFTTLKDSVAEYLFGKKNGEEEVEGENKNIISKAMTSIKNGFNTWGEMIFGAKINEDGTKEDMMASMGEEIKKRAPKTLAGGVMGATAGTVFGTKLGLLTSLFLPGGPISGAIVGSTIGFLSQSEKVKTMLFGEKDDDGERVGNVISKSVQSFFKENKSGIIGGAVVGTLKSMLFPGSGLITSLVGGPLAGALMGSSLAMIKKSTAVQELLYGKGEEGEDGYKKGIINAIKDKFKTEDGKNKLGLAASGALGGMISGTVLSQFGILGAAMFGPVSGAVLGLSLGIASSSDKFRDFMFGDYNEETQKREGGLLGKMTNYLNIEVLQPMKLKIQETALNVNEFFAKNMLAPLQDAIDPFAYQIKLVGENIANKFNEIKDAIADKVNETIVKPISEGINKYLLDPMKNFANKVFGAIFGLVKGIVATPFKFLSSVTNGLVENHKERSFNIERDKLWARDHRNGETGLKGVINSIKGVGTNIKDTVHMYVNQDAREEAEMANAEYIRGRDERIRERNERLNSKFDERRSQLRMQQDEYRRKQRNARDSDYTDINDTEVDEDDIRETRRSRKQKKSDENKRQGFLSRMFKGKRDDTSTEEEDDKSSNATLSPNKDEKSDKSDENKRQRFLSRMSRGKKDDTSTEDEYDDLSDVMILPNKDKKSDKSDKSDENKSNATLSPNKDKKSDKSDENKSNATLSPNKDEKSDESDENKSNATVSANNTSSTSRSSDKGVSTSKYRSSMMKNLEDIRNEVKGQFNGVGINISKIRRILAKRLKDDDTDVAGEDNLSELTIMDKIMYMLSSPIKGITSVIMQPFKLLSAVVGGIVQTGKDIWDGIKSIPGKILSGVGTLISGLGKTVGEVGKAILTVPKVAGEISVELIKGTSKVISAGATAIINATGSILNGAASLFGSILKTTGDLISGTVKLAGSAIAGIPKFVEESSKAMASIASGIIKTIGIAGKGVVDVISTGLKGAVNLISTTLKATTDIITNAAAGILGVLGTPFKIVGGVFKKVTNNDSKKAKVIDGGMLDGIRNPIKVMNVSEGPNKALHVIVDDIIKAVNVKNADDKPASDIKLDGFDLKGKTPLQGILSVIGSIASGITAISSTSLLIHSLLKNKGNTSPVSHGAQQPSENTSSDTPSATISPMRKGVSRARSMKVDAGILGAIIKGEQYKDKQEEKEKAEAEAAADFENVSRKTSEFMTQERAARDREALKNQREEQTIALLTDIRNDTNEHKVGWDAIFSKKGIITGALLLAIPLLMKFLKGGLGNLLGNFLGNVANDAAFGWNTSGGLSGVMDNARDEASDWANMANLPEFIMDNGEFTNTSESRINFLRGRIKNGVKNYSKFADSKAGKLIGKGINSLKEKVPAGFKNIGAKLFGKAQPAETMVNGMNLLGEAPKPKAGIVTKMKDKFVTNLNKSGTQVLDESGKVIATIDQSFLNKAKTLCDDALRILSDALMKVLAKFKVKDTSKIGQLLAKVSKCLTKEKLIAKGSRFLATLSKGATAAATLAASEAVWASLGAISGATNAANLFQVDSSYVDGRMIAISAVFRGLLSTTPGSVIDIINEIVYEVMSFSFVHEVALLVYNLISDEEDYQTLMNAKDEFKQEYLDSIEVEYQKGYSDYLDQGGMEDYETWKANSGYDVTSFSDYNNSKNKSIFGKAIDGVKAGAKWVGDKTNKAWSGFKDGLGKAANFVGDTASSAWSGIKNGAAWLGDKAKDGASWVKDNIAGGAFNDDAIRKEFGLKNNQEIGLRERLSMGIAGKIKTATFGTVKIDPEVINGALITVQNKAKEGWDNIKSTAVKSWTSLKDGVKNATTSLDKGIGGLFGLKDDEGNPIKASESVKLTFDKVGTFCTNTWSDIKTKASDSWASLKKSMSDGWDNFKENTAKGIDVINNTLGNVFGMQDESGNPLSLSKGIKYNAEHAIKWGVDSFKSIKSGFKKWWSDSVDKLGKFWKDITEKIDKGMEVTNKWLGQVFGMKDSNGKDLSLTDGIAHSVNAFTGGVKNKWDSLTGWFDKLANNLINVSRTTLSNGNGGMGESPLTGGKGTDSEQNKDEAGMGGSEMKQGFAMYAQGDPRWGKNPYCGSTISGAGCGPTSMAMVASSLLGNKYYPTEMVNKSNSWKTYQLGAGTTWNYFARAGKHYGIDVSQAGPSEDGIVNAIKAGKPVILSGKSNDVPKADSPFTTGGHFVVAHGVSGDNLIINDPRGESYSKPYKMSNVLKGARQMWSFKANNNNHPAPETGSSPISTYSGNSSSSMSSSTGGTTSGPTSVLDTMTTFFSEFGNRAWDGVLTGQYNTDYSGVFAGISSGANANGATSSFNTTATNLTDELVEMTLQITQEGEGQYDSVNKNDNGAYSVGIMQFHLERAREMFTRLASKLSNPSDQALARKYAGWSNRALSSSEANEMASFLRRNSTIAQSVQKEYAYEILRNSNMAVPLEMLSSGALKDPRSVVLLADIGNTGPDHLKKWRKRYKPVANKSDELLAVRNSLKSSDSYWGRNNGPYKKGWMNRIDKTYNKLSTWQPKFAEAGMGDGDATQAVYDMDNFNIMEGGFGEGDNSQYNFNPQRNETVDTVHLTGGNSNTNRIVDRLNKQHHTTNTTDVAGLAIKLDKIIDVLSSIDGNTGTVSSKLEKLKESMTNVAVVNKSSSSPTIINSGGNNTNLQLGQPSKNETLAKKIAAGI